MGKIKLAYTTQLIYGLICNLFCFQILEIGVYFSLWHFLRSLVEREELQISSREVGG